MTRREGARLAAALLAWLAVSTGAHGQPFEPPANVSSNPGDSRHPHLLLDDSGTLHLVWADDTGVPGHHHRILHARSSDQGRTFSTPTILSASGTSALRPRLAARGASVYVVWTQDSPDTKEVYLVRSVDGGLGFGPPVNLSNTAGESSEARVAVTPAGAVLVVWDEETPSRHLALARSVDGGATFTRGMVAPIVRPLSDCPIDASPSSCTAYPGLAVDARTGNVYVTWHDTVGGKLDVFFTRSTDAGARFAPPLNVSRAPIHAHCAALTVGPSGRILVAYESRKQPPPNPHRHDALLVQSVDAGVTFGPPVNVSGSPLLALSDYPWPVEGPDGTLAVAYEDNAEGGGLDAVVRTSTDGGATFGIRANLSNNPGGTSTEVVALFGPDGTLYVAWQDHGNGPGETQPGEVLLARSPALGATTPRLVVERTGSGTGAVTSEPRGLDCGVTCAATYPAGTPVRLTATPASGSTFAGWTGGGCGASGGACDVSLAVDTTVGARFEPVPLGAEVTLSVGLLGNGQGTVTSEPPGIRCGRECAATYPSGTTLTLVATPGPGVVFQGWTGGGCDGRGSCPVTLHESELVVATFGAVPADLVSAWVNASRFSPGQTLAASLALANPGLPIRADLYVGLVLPDGETIAFFTLDGGIAIGRASEPATFDPIATDVGLEQAFAVTSPDFLRHTWTGAEPPGTYVFFVAALTANAREDGRLDPGEVLASSVAAFTVGP
jgi:List-Bact-rpt repeat protein